MDELNLKDALVYLLNDVILYTYTKDNKTLVAYKNNLIYLQNEYTSYSLSIDEFKDLFSKNIFAIYEDKESIDIEKDNEYYNGLMKKK